MFHLYTDGILLLVESSATQPALDEPRRTSLTRLENSDLYVDLCGIIMTDWLTVGVLMNAIGVFAVILDSYTGGHFAKVKL